MSPIANTPETFNSALARRVLTQQLPTGRPAVLAEVGTLARDVQELASGFEVSAANCREELLRAQHQLADDIESLFPRDETMEHAAAQVRAKSSAAGAETPISRPVQR